MAKYRGPSITKRQFITKATAAISFVSTAGVLQRAYAADEYDVIVIGGGTAGMPCAISAAESGAKVLIIEKADQLGGTLWKSGGSMSAAGTRQQARMGIKDSPDAHYADVMKLSNNKADPAILRRFVDCAGPMADWLEDLGLRVSEGEPVMGRGGHAAFSAARYFRGVESGRSIIKALSPLISEQEKAGRIRTLLSTGASELIVAPDQSVRGVIATAENGERSQLLARKVVIASGGYCASPTMFKRVTGKELYTIAAYYMSKGEGLLLGEGAGGYIRGGENQILGPGAILKDRKYPTTVSHRAVLDHARLPQWAIRVNTEGKRFVCEDSEDIDYRDEAFTKQPGVRMWVIFDQNIWDNAPLIIEDKTKADIEPLFNSHPMFFKAQSIRELAELASLPYQELKATTDNYNSGVRKKKDDLGRQFLPAQISKGPFYAIEFHGGNLVGHGGLAVNADMQCLRKDGTVIQNLHAAGEVIGLSPFCGNTVINGSGVTPSVTFGRLVGQSIMRKA